MQLDVTRLECGADLDRERPAARLAFIHTAAGGFAFQPSDLFPCAPAMRTYRTARPKLPLEKPIGRILVVEVGLGKHKAPGRRSRLIS